MTKEDLWNMNEGEKVEILESIYLGGKVCPRTVYFKRGEIWTVLCITRHQPNNQRVVVLDDSKYNETGLRIPKKGPAFIYIDTDRCDTPWDFFEFTKKQGG